MISIYNLKPKLQKVLNPILIFLHHQKITANQITLSSILLSIIIGIAFWFSDVNSIFFLFLPVGLLLRMALNALDGMMARNYNQQSKLGEVLNEIGDIISDLFIYFPLVKFEKHNIYLIVLFICLSIINEFAGILGKAISEIRRYEGPMGKSDRAFMVSLYGLISFSFSNLLIYSNYLFSLIIILLLYSTYTRIYKTIK